MIKKDIGKILTTGSAKQRLLLLAEDNAKKKFSKERLLTDSEINQLSKSFTKPNEKRLWNKWLNLDSTLTVNLSNLQGLQFEVLMHFSNLRGYILVWDALQEAEEMSNHILHEFKDHKERKRIAEQTAKRSKFLFTDTEVDPEGYLNLNIDFERVDYSDFKNINEEKKTKKYSLWEVMNNVRNQAITSATRYISWRKAILDYMEEEGFNIKTYKDMIKQMDETVYKPIIGWTKYQTDEEQFIPGPTNKKIRVDKLKSKYAITPNIKELEVDTEIYNLFKTQFLGDE